MSTQLMESSVHAFLFIHLFSLLSSFFLPMFVFVERVVKIISTGVQGLGRGPKGIYRCERDEAGRLIRFPPLEPAYKVHANFL